jgi:hypothetical protein
VVIDTHAGVVYGSGMPRVGLIYHRIPCPHVMERGANRSPKMEGEHGDRHEVCELRHNMFMKKMLSRTSPFVPSPFVHRLSMMSGADEAVVRQMEGKRAIGSKEFAATLKMERGRYRVKRGRPSAGA